MDEPQTRMTDVELEGLADQAACTNHALASLINRAIDEIQDARTRSVEPPREMVERARAVIDSLEAYEWMSPQQADAHAKRWAEVLTSVRSQAIEECAAVADKDGVHCPDESYEAACQNVAAAIRRLL